ncbi:uracil-DNA glycosylase [Brevundimonas naejangsanensis]|uniref:Type-4 uracil-DNA glycosylase n=1 Tax=Brevundimonas naejangsanensis TaxID=588932 RepID=A0A494RJJ6_9CAUL|nr:uracil-DNA glycosylase [Brevundimonas naejangsanensis]AYG94066.1 uracil-DNA glycosylase [Brevundimonas naejangsanensis]
MNTTPLDMAAAEALFAFWRDAGVDACFEDAPVDRTVFVAPTPRATATITPIRAPGGAPSIDDAVAEARRLAAEVRSLDDLAQAIAAFEGCPLRAMGARQAVFARGNPQGALMVIGEGPGAEEDARGQPFVGQAGQLLDRILTAGGLLDEAFITNTVFWKTPGARPPTPQEQAICAPFVERAFALLKPRAVLLVGAASAKAVLKTDESIMRVRGQWRDWRLSEGGLSVPAMATLHPAFLLRQPQAKGLVWQDILNLSARLATGAVEPGA